MREDKKRMLKGILLVVFVFVVLYLLPKLNDFFNSWNSVNIIIGFFLSSLLGGYVGSFVVFFFTPQEEVGKFIVCGFLGGLIGSFVGLYICSLIEGARMYSLVEEGIFIDFFFEPSFFYFFVCGFLCGFIFEQIG